VEISGFVPKQRNDAQGHKIEKAKSEGPPNKYVQLEVLEEVQGAKPGEARESPDLGKKILRG